MTPLPLAAPQLSICIATFNRGRFIAQTLETITSQLTQAVELVVVDGASKDNTQAIMETYCEKFPTIRYIREKLNSGVDADFDKAVTYARGSYCWLMTDDDLLVPGAVDQVLHKLAEQPDLLVVNAEVRTANLQHVLQTSCINISQEQQFQQANDSFLRIAGSALSFIGSVVIRRTSWLKRDRDSYYGSLFVHVGVILQPPALQNIIVLAQPLIEIRYGNAMWTSRSFEIWMFMWPNLIWGFKGFSEEAKEAVCQREPWRNAVELFKQRAKGSYSIAEYRKYIRHTDSRQGKIVAALIAHLPANLVNFLAVAYVVTLNRQARVGLSDLIDSPHASYASRILARLFPLSPPRNSVKT